MLQIGEIEIHLLSDGLTWQDGGGPFGLVPRKLWSRYLQPNEDNMVPMGLTCILIKTSGKTLLVDTGLGSRMDEKTRQRWTFSQPDGSLLDGLSRLNLTPEDIDIVINTHLHADHCSGNVMFSASGEIVPVFPRARHITQKREYEDALHPNERTRATYLLENYEPLYRTGQMELIEGDLEVVPGVRAVCTPGHTPGHMSVVIESNGQYALFLCDLASFMIHFEKLGWMTAYDVEPLVTLETKRHWQAWAIEKNALLFSSHDTYMIAARLGHDDNNNPQLIPVPAEFA